jgi:long-subunit fatty acid transport protein
MDFDSSTPIRGVVRDTFQDVAFEQTGGLSTISPAFAIELTRRLSIGATVNLWRSSLLGDNGWTRDSNNSFRVEHPLPGTDILPDLGISRTTNIDATLDIDETYRDFKAANVTLGLLWTPTDRLSLGLRYDSSFTEKVKYRAKVDSRQFRHPDDAAPNGILDEYTLSGSERQKVRFPSFFALGAAFRANDRLILAMSITRADWDDSTLEDGSGTRVSLVDGSENGTEDDINFSPTYTVRLGAEYVFIPKEKDETLNRLWSVRGGAFFDQEPASGKSAGDANGDPEEFYGVTAGVGLLLNQRINIDAAYQFRFGKDVNKDFIRGLPGGFSEDVYQHRFLLSTIIYFGG